GLDSSTRGGNLGGKKTSRMLSSSEANVPSSCISIPPSFSDESTPALNAGAGFSRSSLGTIPKLDKMVRLNGRVGPQPYCLFSNLARRVLRSHCRSLPVSSMLHAGSGPRTHSTKQFRRLRPPIALTQQPIWKSLSAQPSKSHRNVSSMTLHCFQPKRFRGLLGSPKPIGSRCPYRSQLAFDLSQKANPGTTFFCS